MTDRPLYDIGGKGLFAKEIDQARSVVEVESTAQEVEREGGRQRRPRDFSREGKDGGERSRRSDEKNESCWRKKKFVGKIVKDRISQRISWI